MVVVANVCWDHTACNSNMSLAVVDALTHPFLHVRVIQILWMFLKIGCNKFQ